jgi:DNA-binding NarL/FixJ family response regulator
MLAVSMHAAGVDDILAVMCRACGLSRRQRELAVLVVQGLDTQTIASQLCISSYTVQDHLKSIFDKIGVHGWLELVARMFAQVA